MDPSRFLEKTKTAVSWKNPNGRNVSCKKPKRPFPGKNPNGAKRFLEKTQTAVARSRARLKTYRMEWNVKRKIQLQREQENEENIRE
jgi:hypothetical protein